MLTSASKSARKASASALLRAFHPVSQELAPVIEALPFHNTALKFIDDVDRIQAAEIHMITRITMVVMQKSVVGV